MKQEHHEIKSSQQNDDLRKKIEDTLFTAHSLFTRGKVSGSSANISFRHGDIVYISGSGTCFGTLKESDLIPISMTGCALSSGKPSKEWPLHIQLYQKSSDIQAVIHTHSLYCVLWSFVPTQNETDVIPPHTPYLQMKLGKIGFIPYEKPGTEELFQAFRDRIAKSDGFILKNHGPVVPGKSMLDAFFSLEELEESARVAWELYRAGLH